MTYIINDFLHLVLAMLNNQVFIDTSDNVIFEHSLDNIPLRGGPVTGVHEYQHEERMPCMAATHLDHIETHHCTYSLTVMSAQIPNSFHSLLI